MEQYFLHHCLSDYWKKYMDILEIQEDHLSVECVKKYF